MVRAGDPGRLCRQGAGEILVRGDSAYGTSAMVAACVKAKARYSVVRAKNRQ